MKISIVKRTQGLEVVDVTNLNKKQYKALVKNAFAGDSASQLMVARCNLDGLLGVTICPKKAIPFFEMVLANPKSNPDALANAAGSLGWIYYQGLAGVVDKKKAVGYFNKSLEKDSKHSVTRHLLALCYIEGEGVEKVDIKKAIELLEPAVALGHAPSIATLALCYQNGGEGVAKDPTRAFALHLQAAEKHVAASQLYTGMYLYHGWAGQSVDKVKACEWIEKAATQNIVKAQKTIGVFYSQGSGVALDNAKAFFWFKKAADAGDAEACYLTADSLLFGKGTAKNLNDAFLYFGLGAEKGHFESITNLCWCHIKGIGTKKNTKKGIPRLKELAVKKHPAALSKLGLCYLHGWGVPANIQTALEYLAEAAEKDDSDALQILGSFYLDGKYVEQDKNHGFRLTERAFKKGNMNARANLGICYWHGWGVPCDPKKGYALLQKPAAEGVEMAEYCVAIAHLDGNGTAVNKKAAFDRLSALAKKENTKGLTMLGVCYLKGWGTNEDPAAAVRCFQTAANLKHNDAQNYLGACLLIGHGVEKDLARALELFEAVGEKNSDALNNIGWSYLLQGPDFYPQAVDYFKKAEKAGNHTARNNLGWCMMNGFGMIADIPKAIEFFKIASARAKEKNKDGEGDDRYLGMGFSCDNGAFTLSDVNPTLLFLEKASGQQLCTMQKNLALCYQNGWGLEKNPGYAEKLIQAAVIIENFIKVNETKKEEEAKAIEAEKRAKEAAAKAEALVKAKEAEDRARAEAEALAKEKAKEAEDRAKAEAEALEKVKAKEAADRAKAEAEALAIAKAKETEALAMAKAEAEAEDEELLTKTIEKFAEARANTIVVSVTGPSVPVTGTKISLPTITTIDPTLSADFSVISSITTAEEPDSDDDSDSGLDYEVGSITKTQTQMAPTVVISAQTQTSAKQPFVPVVIPPLKLPQSNNAQPQLKPHSQPNPPDPKIQKPQPQRQPLPQPNHHAPIIQKPKIDPIKLATCREEYDKGCEHLRFKRYAGAQIQFNYALSLAKNIGADLMVAYCHGRLAEYYYGAAQFKKAQHNMPVCVEMYKNAVDHCKEAETMVTKLKSTVLNGEASLVESFSQKMKQLSLILLGQYKAEQMALFKLSNPVPLTGYTTNGYTNGAQYYMPQYSAQPVSQVGMTPQMAPHANHSNVKLPGGFH